MYFFCFCLLSLHISVFRLILYIEVCLNICANVALLLFARAFVVDQLLVVAFFLPQSACAETVSLEKPRQNIQITMLLEGLFYGNVVKIVVRYGF